MSDEAIKATGWAVKGTSRPGRDSREYIDGTGELDTMTIGQIADLVTIERKRRELVYGAFQVVGAYVERADHGPGCEYRPARGCIAPSCTCGLNDARAALGIKEQVE